MDELEAQSVVGPADGHIRGSDILAVVVQFFHSCA
jgi:hypothetical protein